MRGKTHNYYRLMILQLKKYSTSALGPEHVINIAETSYKQYWNEKEKQFSMDMNFFGKTLEIRPNISTKLYIPCHSP